MSILYTKQQNALNNMIVYTKHNMEKKKKRTIELNSGKESTDVGTTDKITA